MTYILLLRFKGVNSSVAASQTKFFLSWEYFLTNALRQAIIKYISQLLVFRVLYIFSFGLFSRRKEIVLIT